MATITVEVVYARPDRQALVEVQVEDGATLQEALDASGIYDRFPRDPLRASPAGIWGREVGRDTVLKDGDRVEIYRPLKRDPREARRERALRARD